MLKNLQSGKVNLCLFIGNAAQLALNLFAHGFVLWKERSMVFNSSSIITSWRCRQHIWCAAVPAPRDVCWNELPTEVSYDWFLRWCGFGFLPGN